MKKDRVLVVEDENIVAIDIQRGLKRLGYEVPAVLNSGDEAVRMAAELMPDLILMDIQIKGARDGIDTAEEIWNRFRIPIIFLTAYADERTIERAKKTEPFGYILKPFEESDLHTSIEMALKKHRSIQEREASHQEALAESEEQFKLLVNSVQDYGIYMLDLDGNIKTWNAGAERIKGYTSDEVLGRHFSIFYPEEERRAGTPELALKQVVEKGRFQDEGWRMRKGGIRFWANVNITPLLDKEGKLKGFAKVIRDVTERKSTQESLQSTRDLLQAILDFAPVVIYVKNKQGRYIQANRCFEELVGRPLEQIIGKTDSDLFHQEIVKQFHAHEEIVFQQNQSIQTEEVAFRNGVPHTFLSVRFPLLDSTGNPYAVCVISSDITDRKLAEAQLSQLLKNLQEAMKAREDFISIASHELKTPITSMKLQMQGMLRAIQRGGLESIGSEKFCQSFTRSTQQLDRLTRLVEDMLDISRINCGALTIHKELMNLGELVHEVVDRNKEQLAAAKIPVQLEVEPDLIGNWDRFRIDQVITNLLSNTIKYAAGKPIGIRLSKANDCATLSVTDGGIGIPKDSLERIFDRFERAVAVTNITGLGVGLYIVRHIIQRHGGSIRAESELGKYSTFTVELPLSNSPSRTGGT
jgi:PAS domain S-box-containing protein